MMSCKNQDPVHLPLVFFMLVFGSFIKGHAKVFWVTVEGGECCLNTGWSSSKRFLGLLCLLASHRTQAPALPPPCCHWFSPCCWQEWCREEWRPALGLPPETMDWPCNHLHVPRDTSFHLNLIITDDLLD